MEIRKSKYEKGFAQVANDCLRDARLSWKAKGIIAYAQSNCDSWQIKLNAMQKVSSDGKDSLISGIKELIKYGYCERVQRRDTNGQILGYIYEICDKALFEPQQEKPFVDNMHSEPQGEKPSLEKPALGNPPPNNTISKNNNENKKRGENEFSPSLFPDGEIEQKEKKRGTTENKCLFANSRFYEFDTFVSAMKNEQDLGIDISFYYHSVLDWSARGGKMQKDWIATARSFMRGDKKEGKLQVIKTEETHSADRAAMLRYLNKDYD